MTPSRPASVRCAARTATPARRPPKYGWPWFGDLAGARFDHHPPVQAGVITVADKGHPATGHLGAIWARCDEWYAFTDNPRPRARVLLTVDERSYQGGTMGCRPPDRLVP